MTLKFKICMPCEHCDCGGEAELVNEDGPLLFDTKRDAKHFIVHMGIENAGVKSTRIMDESLVRH